MAPLRQWRSIMMAALRWPPHGAPHTHSHTQTHTHTHTHMHTRAYSSAEPKDPRTDFVFGMGLSYGLFPKFHVGMYC